MCLLPEAVLLGDLPRFWLSQEAVSALGYHVRASGIWVCGERRMENPLSRILYWFLSCLPLFPLFFPPTSNE